MHMTLLFPLPRVLHVYLSFNARSTHSARTLRRKPLPVDLVMAFSSKQYFNNLFPSALLFCVVDCKNLLN